MLNDIYEAILIDWLTRGLIIINKKWEIEPSDKSQTMSMLFADLRNAEKTTTPNRSAKKRGILYRMLHLNVQNHEDDEPIANQRFTQESQEQESNHFSAWFKEQYNTQKNKEKLLGLIKLEYLTHEKFAQLMMDLHHNHFNQHKGLSQSSKWNEETISKFIVKITENYKKYTLLYEQEIDNLNQRNYYKMRIVSLESFSNKEGYDLLIDAINDLVEIAEKKSYINKAASDAPQRSHHAQNVLLLLGIVYEKISAEENFYASIYLIKLLSSTDKTEFQTLISEFNDFFIEIVNIDSRSYNAIIKAKSDSNATLATYRSEIDDAFDTLISTMSGCSLTELEKIFSDEMPESHKRLSVSKRSTSHSGVYEGLLSGFLTHGRRSHVSSASSVTSSSSSSSSSSSRSTSSTLSSRKTRLESQ